MLSKKPLVGTSWMPGNKPSVGASWMPGEKVVEGVSGMPGKKPLWKPGKKNWPLECRGKAFLQEPLECPGKSRSGRSH